MGKYIKIFGLLFLTGCIQSTASLIGPAYTIGSSGNIYQAGLSYGSNEIITSYTGKTPIENLEELTSKNLSAKNNIQKRTLESDDFYQLVKKRIDDTRGKIKLINQ